MTAFTIDTYALVTKLKEAGIPEQQAAAQVEIITKTIDTAIEQARHENHIDDMATKRDFKELELKIELVKSDLKRDIAESKDDLRKWMTTVVFGTAILQTAIIAALVLKLAGHI